MSSMGAAHVCKAKHVGSCLQDQGLNPKAELTWPDFQMGQHLASSIDTTGWFKLSLTIFRKNKRLAKSTY